MIQKHSNPGRPRPKPYALEQPGLVGPSLPGEVVVANTADELIDRLAAEMVAQGKLAVRQLGDFQLALSGGSTPQPLYERLMYDPNFRSLPWMRTHLWLVDERCVPFDDERSNYRMIKETIVDHSGIPPEQVHPIAALEPAADRDYETKLREVLEWRRPGADRLDFVLLGLGADGHTASLFPFTDVLDERQRLVRGVTAPDAAPPQRVTMTFPLINAARMVVVLATGPEKAEPLRRAAGGQESVQELPIKGVRPIGGELKWFLDGPACGAKQRR